MTNRDSCKRNPTYRLNSHLSALFGFRFEDERGVTHSGFGNNSTAERTTVTAFKDKESLDAPLRHWRVVGEQCSFWLRCTQDLACVLLFKPAMTASSAEQN